MVGRILVFFFFQAEDGIRDSSVTGVRRVLFRSIGSTFTRSHTGVRPAKVLPIPRSHRPPQHHVWRRSQRLQLVWASHASLLPPPSRVESRSDGSPLPLRTARIGRRKVSGPALSGYATERGYRASADDQTSHIVDGRSFQRSRPRHAQGYAT